MQRYVNKRTLYSQGPTLQPSTWPKPGTADDLLLYIPTNFVADPSQSFLPHQLRVSPPIPFYYFVTYLYYRSITYNRFVYSNTQLFLLHRLRYYLQHTSHFLDPFSSSAQTNIRDILTHQENIEKT